MHTVNWVRKKIPLFDNLNLVNWFLTFFHPSHQLATATNPSVGTVKNFIHLLDDSELDFDQELSEYLHANATLNCLHQY